MKGQDGNEPWKNKTITFFDATSLSNSSFSAPRFVPDLGSSGCGSDDIQARFEHLGASASEVDALRVMVSP
jgi:hypothetical protein